MSADPDIVEETAYVVFDLGSDITLETLRKEAADHNGVSLVGIDTAKPVLRVGNWVYQGEPDILIGTDMIFKVASPSTTQPAAQVAEPSADKPRKEQPHPAPPAVHYIGEAKRIVKFNRVALRSAILAGDTAVDVAI
ncbi:hypothetical protein BASA50_002055 [Batrachochytrium salamandrivorans]|uniref:Transcription factor TFIIIC triple barrel domain-containing protein n=1 Tax=Batrachochytrium salamandrivorans TaxID=1357716 RepID=A0ABQ8FQ32_9FUNG|nr:hypothetical protein BASA60_007229 [Batrachochytrium salamandrivorans]KAH6576706.1 hypothetical protein BASA62_001275 [Batrachochytrium salamandrivorans]KAH6592612.1 hypothetical protein BASA61_004495 [Batrachochytrium salamandrivorans]KAH6600671.1 hypothetical protein BASA50_002055 [Batrachochytrium salamandrivorans]KAH9246463.1 hypothetical protein BASA81_015994 [Batrachochytrium salamandrivorans]